MNVEPSSPSRGYFNFTGFLRYHVTIIGPKQILSFWGGKNSSNDEPSSTPLTTESQFDSGSVIQKKSNYLLPSVFQTWGLVHRNIKVENARQKELRKSHNKAGKVLDTKHLTTLRLWAHISGKVSYLWSEHNSYSSNSLSECHLRRSMSL